MVKLYKTIWRHIPEDGIFLTHTYTHTHTPPPPPPPPPPLRESQISHKCTFFFLTDSTVPLSVMTVLFANTECVFV